MQSEASSNRRPINAELIGRKSSHLAAQLEVLAPLSDALAEHAGTSMSQLGGMPVKVTMMSTKVEKLSPLSQAEPGFDIISPEATVLCWGRFDRQFDSLMCDICLGSNGNRKAHHENDRPPTIFERKLRGLVFEHLIQAMTKALSEIGEKENLMVQARVRTPLRKSLGELQCYNMRLLVNAFDAACECELLFSLSECVGLLGGDMSLSKPVSTQRVVEDTSFPLEIYLQPDLIDVRQILNLAPGEVLKLNIRASAPVELRMNGQMLSRGLLCFENKQGRVRVLEAEQHPASSHSMRGPSIAAGQNGN